MLTVDPPAPESPPPFDPEVVIREARRRQRRRWLLVGGALIVAIGSVVGVAGPLGGQGGPRPTGPGPTTAPTTPPVPPGAPSSPPLALDGDFEASEVLAEYRMRLAEEQAAKIGTKMIFPLAFCLFPSFFLVAVGPAVVRLVTVFGHMMHR